MERNPTSSNSAFRCLNRSRWLVTMGKMEVSAEAEENGIGVDLAEPSSPACSRPLDVDALPLPLMLTSFSLGLRSSGARRPMLSKSARSSSASSLAVFCWFIEPFTLREDEEKGSNESWWMLSKSFSNLSLSSFCFSSSDEVESSLDSTDLSCSWSSLCRIWNG
jgi:hypothetical protein